MGKEIGDHLKDYRLKHNLKREKVALDLGVSFNYIYALEQGHKKSVSQEMLIKIARYLKVSTDELLGLKTPKK